MNGNEKLKSAVYKIKPDAALKDKTREAVMAKMKKQQNGEVKLKSRAMEYTAAAAAFVVVAGIGAGVISANIGGKDTELYPNASTVSENFAYNEEQTKSFDEYMSDLKADIAHGGWYMQYCDVYGDESDGKYTFYLLTTNSYPYQSEGIRSMRYYLIGYDMDILTDEQKSEIDNNMDVGLSAAMAKKEDDPLWESQFIDDLWYEDAIGVIASTYDLDIEDVNEKQTDENTLQNILDFYGINGDEMNSDGNHLLDMIYYIPTKNGCVGVMDSETTISETQNDTRNITYNVTDGRPLQPEDILPNMQPAAYRDGSVGEFNYLSLLNITTGYDNYNFEELCTNLKNEGYVVNTILASSEDSLYKNTLAEWKSDNLDDNKTEFDFAISIDEAHDNQTSNVFVKSGSTINVIINDRNRLKMKATNAYESVLKGLADCEANQSFTPVEGTYTIDSAEDFEGRNDNVTAGYLHEWIKNELEDGFKFDIKILGYDVISVTCWDEEGNYSTYAPETVWDDSIVTDIEDGTDNSGDLYDPEKVHEIFNHIQEEMSDDILFFDNGIFTIDLVQGKKDTDDIKNFTTEDYLYEWVSDVADDKGKYYITVKDGKVTKVECDYSKTE